MRSLREFITESTSELRFIPGDLENGKDTVKSLISIAQKNDIYAEEIDGGVKFKMLADKKDKYEALRDIMQQYVDGLTSKEEDVDQTKVEKLASQLSKLNDWLDAEDEPEKTPEDNKKEDDKDDKESKKEGEDE